MPEYGSVVERRSFPRYSLHLAGEAEALFRRPPTHQEGEDEPLPDGRYHIDVVNISQGGLQLIFGVAFDAHDVIRMYFTHPSTGARIVTEGELVWVRKNAMKVLGKYYAGLAFRDTHQEGIKSLVDYAATLGPPLAN